VDIYNQDLDFQLHMSRCFFCFFYMFNDLKWEVIVRFVDIGGIVDHQCLNFLFILTEFIEYNRFQYTKCHNSYKRQSSPWFVVYFILLFNILHYWLFVLKRYLCIAFCIFRWCFLWIAFFENVWLFKTRTSISNFICRGVFFVFFICSMIWSERWLFFNILHYWLFVLKRYLCIAFCIFRWCFLWIAFCMNCDILCIGICAVSYFL
jgi:hypothetical protein